MNDRLPAVAARELGRTQLACSNRPAGHGVRFGESLRQLWLEYEVLESRESRWVKVVDRVMPFAVNPAIRRSQVLAASKPVRGRASAWRR